MTDWPDDVKVVRYDAEGLLVGELEHDKGMLREPVTLNAGETLWLARPGAEQLVSVPADGVVVRVAAST